jgi:hypothetical protein
MKDLLNKLKESNVEESDARKIAEALDTALWATIETKRHVETLRLAIGPEIKKQYPRRSQGFKLVDKVKTPTKEGLAIYEILLIVALVTLAAVAASTWLVPV